MPTRALWFSVVLTITATATATATAAPRTLTGLVYQQPSAPAAVLRSQPPRGELSEVQTDVELGTARVWWGSGRQEPDVMADPEIAESAARRALADNVARIAPGARAEDFVVVTNQVTSDGRRNVGFVQTANGLRVFGSAVGVVFFADRLQAVLARAYPNVAVTSSARRAEADVRAAALTWLASDGVAAQAGSLRPDRVIVPVVVRTGGGARVSYHITQVVDVAQVGGLGRWDVYVDDFTGHAVARRATRHFGSGTVTYNVPTRYPAGGMADLPAAFAAHNVGTADGNGLVSFAGASAALSPGLTGPFVKVINAADALATTALTLADGGTASWNSSNELINAQLSAFIHANIAKSYARRIAGDLPWLEQQLSVFVNEQNVCNAYSTGDDIHFLIAGSGCENTARLADVVYHEFGHSLHTFGVIEGVGVFESAVSEGMSDVFSGLITGDASLGVGFFFSSEPLRELDPPAKENIWPADAIGQPHNDGLIIGGAMWDLRKALIAQLGPEAGAAAMDRIFWGILQRSQDMLTSYAAALVADDDDGNMANGTPNRCAIQATFAEHGLVDVSASIRSHSPPTADGLAVQVLTQPLTGDCPGPAVTGATLRWRVRGGAAQELPMAATDVGAGVMAWRATMPPQDAGTYLDYDVVVQLADGDMQQYPDNPLDPFYEIYVGTLEPIYCADFETTPADWQLQNDFHQGSAFANTYDPPVAAVGSGLLGTAIGGAYSPGVVSTARMPAVDTSGYEVVQLRFWRWLTVEAGVYDTAEIRVAGESVWRNPVVGETDHFIDREWRQKSIDVTAAAASGSVQPEFVLTADEGVEFGGWSLDQVCVMGRRAGAAGVCGDGALDDGEACDDGNLTIGDGCSADCDDESGPDPEGGCCGASDPRAALAFVAIAAGLLRRRRKIARA